MNSIKKNVKIFRCDNAGEKKNREEDCTKNFEEINFQFTSSGTPQKNDVLERVFLLFILGWA